MLRGAPLLYLGHMLEEIYINNTNAISTKHYFIFTVYCWQLLLRLP